jgi:hypothetical protein
LPDFFQVDLLHLKHGFHGSLRFFGVMAAYQFAQRPGDNLPRQAEFVLQPTAPMRLLVPALGELRSVKIDLFLSLAQDLKRDGLIELEHWAAVERGKCLAVELEIRLHQFPPACRESRSLPSRSA